MFPLSKMEVVFLFLCLVSLSSTAPVQDSVKRPGRVPRTQGCYYNAAYFSNGERILTNEPCLNCTCTEGMLMCYLRVCPFVKPLGEECIEERNKDDCCPKIWCPEVIKEKECDDPEHDLKHDHPGCYLDGKYFPDGAMLPHDPKKPCEVCYCIRNSTSCVVQECELKVDGCSPVYKEGQCCPCRYNCTYIESTTVPPGFTIQDLAEGCVLNDGRYIEDGEAVNSTNPCEHCYCMRNEVVCAIQECQAPGDNCKPLSPKPGQCCPDRYDCPVVGITPELSTHSFSNVFTTEEAFTQSTFKTNYGIKTSSQKGIGIKGLSPVPASTQKLGVKGASGIPTKTSSPPSSTSDELSVDESKDNDVEESSDVSIEPEVVSSYGESSTLKYDKTTVATEGHSVSEDTIKTSFASEEYTDISTTEKEPVSLSLSTTSPMIKETSQKQADTKEVSSKGISSVKVKGHPQKAETDPTKSPEATRFGVKGGIHKDVRVKETFTHFPFTLHKEGTDEEKSETDKTTSLDSLPIESSHTKNKSQIYITSPQDEKSEEKINTTLPSLKLPTSVLRIKEQNRTVQVPTIFEEPETQTYNMNGTLEKRPAIKHVGVKGTPDIDYGVKGKQPSYPSRFRPILPIGAIPGESKKTAPSRKRPIVMAIPGEGGCRVGKIVYQNGQFMRSTNICKKNCQCINSVVYCDDVICEKPKNVQNCISVRVPNECCPQHICSSSSVPPTQSPTTQGEGTVITPSSTFVDKTSESPLPIASLDSTFNDTSSSYHTTEEITTTTLAPSTIDKSTFTSLDFSEEKTSIKVTEFAEISSTQAAATTLVPTGSTFSSIMTEETISTASKLATESYEIEKASTLEPFSITDEKLSSIPVTASSTRSVHHTITPIITSTETKTGEKEEILNATTFPDSTPFASTEKKVFKETSISVDTTTSAPSIEPEEISTRFDAFSDEKIISHEPSIFSEDSGTSSTQKKEDLETSPSVHTTSESSLSIEKSSTSHKELSGEETISYEITSMPSTLSEDSGISSTEKKEILETPTSIHTTSESSLSAEEFSTPHVELSYEKTTILEYSSTSSTSSEASGISSTRKEEFEETSIPTDTTTFTPSATSEEISTTIDALDTKAISHSTMTATSLETTNIYSTEEKEIQDTSTSGHTTFIPSVVPHKFSTPAYVLSYEKTIPELSSLPSASSGVSDEVSTEKKEFQEASTFTDRTTFAQFITSEEISTNPDDLSYKKTASEEHSLMSSTPSESSSITSTEKKEFEESTSLADTTTVASPFASNETSSPDELSHEHTVTCRPPEDSKITSKKTDEAYMFVEITTVPQFITSEKISINSDDLSYKKTTFQEDSQRSSTPSDSSSITSTEKKEFEESTSSADTTTVASSFASNETSSSPDELSHEHTITSRPPEDSKITSTKTDEAYMFVEITTVPQFITSEKISTNSDDLSYEKTTFQEDSHRSSTPSDSSSITSTEKKEFEESTSSADTTTVASSFASNETSSSPDELSHEHTITSRPPEDSKITSTKVNEASAFTDITVAHSVAPEDISVTFDTLSHESTVFYEYSTSIPPSSNPLVVTSTETKQFDDIKYFSISSPKETSSAPLDTKSHETTISYEYTPDSSTPEKNFGITLTEKKEFHNISSSTGTTTFSESSEHSTEEKEFGETSTFIGFASSKAPGEISSFEELSHEKTVSYDYSSVPSTSSKASEIVSTEIKELEQRSSSTESTPLTLPITTGESSVPLDGKTYEKTISTEYTSTPFDLQDISSTESKLYIKTTSYPDRTSFAASVASGEISTSLASLSHEETVSQKHPSASLDASIITSTEISQFSETEETYTEKEESSSFNVPYNDSTQGTKFFVSTTIPPKKTVDLKEGTFVITVSTETTEDEKNFENERDSVQSPDNKTFTGYETEQYGNDTTRSEKPASLLSSTTHSPKEEHLKLTKTPTFVEKASLSTLVKFSSTVADEILSLPPERTTNEEKGTEHIVTTVSTETTEDEKNFENERNSVQSTDNKTFTGYETEQYGNDTPRSEIPAFLLSSSTHSPKEEHLKFTKTPTFVEKASLSTLMESPTTVADEILSLPPEGTTNEQKGTEHIVTTVSTETTEDEKNFESERDSIQSPDNKTFTGYETEQYGNDTTRSEIPAFLLSSSTHSPKEEHLKLTKTPTFVEKASLSTLVEYLTTVADEIVSLPPERTTNEQKGTEHIVTATKLSEAAFDSEELATAEDFRKGEIQPSFINTFPPTELPRTDNTPNMVAIVTDQQGMTHFEKSSSSEKTSIPTTLQPSTTKISIIPDKNTVHLDESSTVEEETSFTEVITLSTHFESKPSTQKETATPEKTTTSRGEELLKDDILHTKDSLSEVTSTAIPTSFTETTPHTEILLEHTDTKKVHFSTTKSPDAVTEKVKESTTDNLAISTNEILTESTVDDNIEIAIPTEFYETKIKTSTESSTADASESTTQKIIVTPNRTQSEPTTDSSTVEEVTIQFLTSPIITETAIQDSTPENFSEPTVEDRLDIVTKTEYAETTTTRQKDSTIKISGESSTETMQHSTNEITDTPTEKAEIKTEKYKESTKEKFSESTVPESTYDGLSESATVKLVGEESGKVPELPHHVPPNMETIKEFSDSTKIESLGSKIKEIPEAIYGKSPETVITTEFIKPTSPKLPEIETEKSVEPTTIKHHELSEEKISTSTTDKSFNEIKISTEVVTEKSSESTDNMPTTLSHLDSTNEIFADTTKDDLPEPLDEKLEKPSSEKLTETVTVTNLKTTTTYKKPETDSTKQSSESTESRASTVEYFGKFTAEILADSTTEKLKDLSSDKPSDMVVTDVAKMTKIEPSTTKKASGSRTEEILVTESITENVPQSTNEKLKELSITSQSTTEERGEITSTGISELIAEDISKSTTAFNIPSESTVDESPETYITKLLELTTIKLQEPITEDTTSKTDTTKYEFPDVVVSSKLSESVSTKAPERTTKKTPELTTSEQSSTTDYSLEMNASTDLFESTPGKSLVSEDENFAESTSEYFSEAQSHKLPEIFASTEVSKSMITKSPISTTGIILESINKTKPESAVEELADSVSNGDFETEVITKSSDPTTTKLPESATENLGQSTTEIFSETITEKLSESTIYKSPETEVKKEFHHTMTTEQQKSVTGKFDEATSEPILVSNTENLTESFDKDHGFHEIFTTTEIFEKSSKTTIKEIDESKIEKNSDSKHQIVPESTKGKPLKSTALKSPELEIAEFFKPTRDSLTKTSSVKIPESTTKETVDSTTHDGLITAETSERITEPLATTAFGGLKTEKIDKSTLEKFVTSQETPRTTIFGAETTKSSESTTEELYVSKTNKNDESTNKTFESIDHKTTEIEIATRLSQPTTVELPESTEKLAWSTNEKFPQSTSEKSSEKDETEFSEITSTTTTTVALSSTDVFIKMGVKSKTTPKETPTSLPISSTTDISFDEFSTHHDIIIQRETLPVVSMDGPENLVSHTQSFTQTGSTRISSTLTTSDMTTMKYVPFKESFVTYEKGQDYYLPEEISKSPEITTPPTQSVEKYSESTSAEHIEAEKVQIMELVTKSYFPESTTKIGKSTETLLGRKTKPSVEMETTLSTTITPLEITTNIVQEMDIVKKISKSPEMTKFADSTTQIFQETVSEKADESTTGRLPESTIYEKESTREPSPKTEFPSSTTVKTPESTDYELAQSITNQIAESTPEDLPESDHKPLQIEITTYLPESTKTTEITNKNLGHLTTKHSIHSTTDNFSDLSTEKSLEMVVTTEFESDTTKSPEFTTGKPVELSAEEHLYQSTTEQPETTAKTYVESTTKFSEPTTKSSGSVTKDLVQETIKKTTELTTEEIPELSTEKLTELIIKKFSEAPTTVTDKTPEKVTTTELFSETAKPDSVTKIFTEPTTKTLTADKVDESTVKIFQEIETTKLPEFTTIKSHETTTEKFVESETERFLESTTMKSLASESGNLTEPVTDGITNTSPSSTTKEYINITDATKGTITEILASSKPGQFSEEYASSTFSGAPDSFSEHSASEEYFDEIVLSTSSDNAALLNETEKHGSDEQTLLTQEQQEQETIDSDHIVSTASVYFSTTDTDSITAKEIKLTTTTEKEIPLKSNSISKIHTTVSTYDEKLETIPSTSYPIQGEIQHIFEDLSHESVAKVSDSELLSDQSTIGHDNFDSTHVSDLENTYISQSTDVTKGKEPLTEVIFPKISTQSSLHDSTPLQTVQHIVDSERQKISTDISSFETDADLASISFSTIFSTKSGEEKIPSTDNLSTVQSFQASDELSHATTAVKLTDEIFSSTTHIIGESSYSSDSTPLQTVQHIVDSERQTISTDISSFETDADLASTSFSTILSTKSGEEKIPTTDNLSTVQSFQASDELSHATTTVKLTDEIFSSTTHIIGESSYSSDSTPLQTVQHIVDSERQTISTDISSFETDADLASTSFSTILSTKSGEEKIPTTDNLSTVQSFQASDELSHATTTVKLTDEIFSSTTHIIGESSYSSDSTPLQTVQHIVDSESQTISTDISSFETDADLASTSFSTILSTKSGGEKIPTTDNLSTVQSFQASDELSHATTTVKLTDEIFSSTTHIIGESSYSSEEAEADKFTNKRTSLPSDTFTNEFTDTSLKTNESTEALDTEYEIATTDPSSDITFKYITTAATTYWFSEEQDKISSDTAKSTEILASTLITTTPKELISDKEVTELPEKADITDIHTSVLTEIIEKEHGSNDVFDVPKEIHNDTEVSTTVSVSDKDDDTFTSDSQTPVTSPHDKHSTDILPEEPYTMQSTKLEDKLFELSQNESVSDAYASSTEKNIEETQTYLYEQETKTPLPDSFSISHDAENFSSEQTDSLLTDETHISHDLDSETMTSKLPIVSPQEEFTSTPFESYSSTIKSSSEHIPTTIISVLDDQNKTFSMSTILDEKSTQQTESISIISPEEIIYNFTAKKEYDLKQTTVTPVISKEHLETTEPMSVSTKSPFSDGTRDETEDPGTQTTVQIPITDSLFENKDKIGSPSQIFYPKYNTTELKVPDSSHQFVLGDPNFMTPEKMGITQSKLPGDSSPSPGWVAHPLHEEIIKALSTMFPSSPATHVYEIHTSPSTTGSSSFLQQTYENEGVCYFEGRIYMSSEQIPRKDNCEFCFCFKGDIICLQQTCPPPIKGCYAIPIEGFCCPRFHCPVKQTWFNSSTTTTTTLVPFDPSSHKSIPMPGCQIEGQSYRLHQVVQASSNPCMLCRCDYGGIMKCDPRTCKPDAPIMEEIAQAYAKRRR